MKKVEFPFDLGDAVCILLCVGPTVNDVCIKRGRVTELSLDLTGQAVTVELSNDHSSYSTRLISSDNIPLVFYPAQEEKVITELQLTKKVLHK